MSQNVSNFIYFFVRLGEVLQFLDFEPDGSLDWTTKVTRYFLRCHVVSHELKYFSFDRGKEKNHVYCTANNMLLYTSHAFFFHFALLIN